MKRTTRTPRVRLLVRLLALAVAAPAGATNLVSNNNWDVSLDTTLQYTNGWRQEGRDDGIGNHPFYAQGNYKFDKGDRVTNRLQGIVEFQAVYNKATALRVSGSYWKDWAYDDKVRTNPNPAFSTFLTYPGGRYSSVTKKYTIEGGELLDAFISHNTSIGDVPVYIKAGRFTQHWGNAFFFGFSNIAYSQHPVDYAKAFAQPGSEIKELFLPRRQVMLTADLTPELSVSAQLFGEYRENRFPETATSAVSSVANLSRSGVSGRVRPSRHRVSAIAPKLHGIDHRRCTNSAIAPIVGTEESTAGAIQSPCRWASQAPPEP